MGIQVMIPSLAPNQVASKGQKHLTAIDIDLSLGFTNQQFSIPGHQLYCDLVSTGIAFVALDSESPSQDNAVMLTAGGIINHAFSRFRLNAPSQPGKSMRLIVALGAYIRPGGNPNPGNVQISTIETINPQCQMIAADGATAIGGNNQTQIIAPASNPRGVNLRSIEMSNAAGAGGTIASYLVAAASIPSLTLSQPTPQANSILLATILNSATTTAFMQDAKPAKIIPPTWGVWRLDSVGTAIAAASKGTISVEFL